MEKKGFGLFQSQGVSAMTRKGIAGKVMVITNTTQGGSGPTKESDVLETGGGAAKFHIKNSLRSYGVFLCAVETAP